MKVKDLLKNQNLTLLTEEDSLDNEFFDVYIGDLLSWVMGNGKPKSIWLTILGHMNIVAVASLREISCIVICEDANIQEDVIKRCNEEKIAILKTTLTSYEVAKYLAIEL